LGRVAFGAVICHDLPHASGHVSEGGDRGSRLPDVPANVIIG